MANELMWIKLTGTDFTGFAKQLNVTTLTPIPSSCNLSEADNNNLKTIYTTQTFEKTRLVFIKVVRHLFKPNEYFASTVIKFDDGFKDHQLYYTPHIIKSPPDGWADLNRHAGSVLISNYHNHFRPSLTDFTFSAPFPKEWNHVRARILSRTKFEESKFLSAAIKSLCEHKFAFQVVGYRSLSFVDSQYFYTFSTVPSQFRNAFFVYLMDDDSYEKLCEQDRSDQIASIKNIIINSIQPAEGETATEGS